MKPGLSPRSTGFQPVSRVPAAAGRYAARARGASPAAHRRARRPHVVSCPPMRTASPAGCSRSSRPRRCCSAWWCACCGWRLRGRRGAHEICVARPARGRLHSVGALGTLPRNNPLGRDRPRPGRHGRPGNPLRRRAGSEPALPDARGVQRAHVGRRQPGPPRVAIPRQNPPHLAQCAGHRSPPRLGAAEFSFTDWGDDESTLDSVQAPIWAMLLRWKVRLQCAYSPIGTGLLGGS